MQNLLNRESGIERFQTLRREILHSVIAYLKSIGTRWAWGYWLGRKSLISNCIRRSPFHSLNSSM